MEMQNTGNTGNTKHGDITTEEASNSVKSHIYLITLCITQADYPEGLPACVGAQAQRCLPLNINISSEIFFLSV